MATRVVCVVPAAALAAAAPLAGHQHQPGRDIGQEEREFSLGVGRIQRGGGRAQGRDGEQQKDHVGAVGQGQRDPIAALDAQAGKPLRERLDPVRGLRVRQNLTTISKRRRPARPDQSSIRIATMTAS